MEWPLEGLGLSGYSFCLLEEIGHPIWRFISFETEEEVQGFVDTAVLLGYDLNEYSLQYSIGSKVVPIPKSKYS